MLSQVIVYVLTALAAVVVVLTRLRLGRESGGAGRLNMGRGLVNVHTVAGTLALDHLVVFLVAGEDSAAGSATRRHRRPGLLVGHRGRRPADPGALAAHPRPARLRRAAADSWSEGPWLSVLAHVGTARRRHLFTFAYVTSTV